jgi:hypothetical protein
MSVENDKQEITVVDVKMPFMSMVVFMVKFAIASTPWPALFYTLENRKLLAVEKHYVSID